MATRNQSNLFYEGWFSKLPVLGLVSTLVIGGTVVSCRRSVLAQIVPDASLGTESSVVNNDVIEKGARRGANLFHSFLEFNVGTGQKVYFANPSGIENIVSRVTGSNQSHILGTLGVNGSANLFLLNPNGIIFGPNANLALRGSFIASTANSIKFSDGTQFSTTNPETKPLLTISVPIGLQFGEGDGAIINRSQASLDGAINSEDGPVGLQVQPGKTLALVGSGVIVEDGNLTAGGNFTDIGGRIEIGSVAGSSLVSLIPKDQGWSLAYEGIHNFKDILFQGAFVDASGTRGGEIQLQGRRVTFDASSSSITTIISQTLDKNGGDIIINGTQVSLQKGSVVISSTNGLGRGGNLLVSALESVKAGNVGFYTSAFGFGTAGDVRINTGRLSIQDGGQVSASSKPSDASGNVTINALESVEVIGRTVDGKTASGLFAQASERSSGNGGEVKINTRRLIVRDGAAVSVGTRAYSRGRGGNLVVNASDSVEVIGTGINENHQVVPSSLFAASEGGGNAGNLAVETNKLIVRDGAKVEVSSQGTGAAGNLKVISPSVLLDNGIFSAETTAGQGNINLASQNLVLRRGSKITTSATGTATGGNITIKTGVLTALEDSNIRANADKGPGGRVIINAQGIFGTEFQQQGTLLSNITASSTLGPKFSGTVQINTLGINPSFGLVNLPVQPVDVTGLIAQSCPADVGSRGSKFVVTGRGGLPSTPSEALRSEPALVDLGTTVPSQENHASPGELSNPTTSSEPAPLVEATGWVTNALGEVVLVATAPTVTVDIPWLTPTTCHVQ